MNIAVNAATLVAAPSIAVANDGTDTELLALEEQIWKLDEKAHEHDEKIFKLQGIWFEAQWRLNALAIAGLCSLGKSEIRDLFSAMLQGAQPTSSISSIRFMRNVIG